MNRQAMASAFTVAIKIITIVIEAAKVVLSIGSWQIYPASCIPPGNRKCVVPFYWQLIKKQEQQTPGILGLATKFKQLIYEI